MFVLFVLCNLFDYFFLIILLHTKKQKKQKETEASLSQQLVMTMDLDTTPTPPIQTQAQQASPKITTFEEGLAMLDLLEKRNGEKMTDEEQTQALMDSGMDLFSD